MQNINSQNIGQVTFQETDYRWIFWPIPFRLRRLLRPCEFVDQEENLLKALIALGIRSKETQQKLLLREDMSLDKVVNFLKSVERADKNKELPSREWEESRRIEEICSNLSSSAGKY